MKIFKEIMKWVMGLVIATIVLVAICWLSDFRKSLPPGWHIEQNVATKKYRLIEPNGRHWITTQDSKIHSISIAWSAYNAARHQELLKCNKWIQIQ